MPEKLASWAIDNKLFAGAFLAEPIGTNSATHAKTEGEMELKDKKVIIIGGSSGIGLGVAKAAVAKGAYVIIAGRSRERLEKAAEEIGGKVDIRVLDATKEEEVKGFFDGFETFDHLVCTIHAHEPSTLGRAMAPFAEVPTDAARQWMETKFWGQYFSAKCGAPKLSPKGSITLTAGVGSRRWVPNHAVLATANAAVGAFGFLLAQEVGPKRVNVVSPGVVKTPTYDFIPEADREALFGLFETRLLPVKHVATPEEIAQTYIYLMECDYHTGDVICVDGGLLSGSP
jgi:NAD(P)-dependent dehydrogenase (short-subunit alcohol dehydrogenase family)